MRRPIVHRQRFEHTNHVRFLTCSCRRRLQFFKNDSIKSLFVDHLTAARAKHGFGLIAWVLMPEHFHIMVWPRLPESPVPFILRSLKQPIAQRVVARWRELEAPILARIVDSKGASRFWERGGGDDRNLYTPQETNKKLRYIHANPVRRGLVAKPEDWP